MGILSDEICKVVHRKRRGYRFTQDDLGTRIGVSGSYISGIENGKTSPRVVELEDMAAHFRTTAVAMILEAAQASEGWVPTEGVPHGEDTLDAIAADLSPAHRQLAREFLIFLRERERVDHALED
ncbi:MAG: helix-turn-helix domain-containing protein [Anaerolineae bacterium]|jgi:transcriptional regulator with XRE-family HTH domain|nr:helix-turn-helix transcriptional regulator [Ardenticatenia bacterium]MBK8541716.1 helix-turn-helix transcriptional regulator [Ardenticatenia bacterium]HQZ71601.1 helix-turn-helix transcriptional regulator [Anaerolineae bacterium]HRA19801.1 helix-turn-helix transcriptional regulator [Anaerolineae bacterium]